VTSIVIMVAITAAMIFATALYVAAEFAATISARRPRIRQEAASGNRLAQLLEPILSEPRRLDAYIATCQLGITASSLVLGYYGQSGIATALYPLLERLGGLQRAAAESLAATIVLVVLTFLTVLLGELVPKSLATRNPERWALRTALPMRWSMALFRPAIALFNGTGSLILRLMRVPPAEHHVHLHSPEEIESLVAESAKGGMLEEDERRLLASAFRVGDLTAADVMVPRPRLVAAPIATPLSTLLDLATTSAYTRIPLYQETIDDVVGFVHLRDLFRLYVEGREDVASVLRPAPFVPETKDAVEVWNLLQQEHSYVAIVFDEFGGTAGMITIEDLIEEVFGELREEFREDPALIAPAADGCVRLHGEVLIEDVNELFDLDLPSTEVHTIGGLVMALLGRTPQVGDEADVAGIRLRVEAVTGVAVREVTLCPPPGQSLTAPDGLEQPL
jgi:CBS domain containing-hemolysin-like protein